MTSSSRVRLVSAARSLQLGLVAPRIQPGDAGGILEHLARRSVGLAAIKVPTRPWLTSDGECAPGRRVREQGLDVARAHLDGR
jgi:hypothetical protein